MQELIAKLVFYLAPMYFANSCAMVFGGKTPIDFGAKFVDGKPLFGTGKTFKGAVFGVLAGTMISLLLSFASPGQASLVSGNYALLGFLLSVGSIVGDMAGSFAKRRMGFGQGKEVLFLDQLDFVAGGIAFGSILYLPSLVEIAVIVIVTLVVHRVSNYVAFRAKLKKVPW